MFGIDSSEFLLIAVIALLVIGPKDLPRVMRLVGGWVGRGRAMTRHLRSGFDTMMREAELEEMQKQWAKQNADIMAATQVSPVPQHAYDGSVYSDDPAATPNIHDIPVVEPRVLPSGTAQISDSHVRESGDPMSDIPTLGPRFRGDDGVNSDGDVATVMAGPQPPPVVAP